MNKTLKNKLIEWSLGKNNAKLIPDGGEILRSIGSEMLLIKFSRNQETGEWGTETPIPVYIKEIGNYEPMTGTYQIKYSGKDIEETTERITPEGFSFNNPEEDGWMNRFITYSLHFKMMEDELYYNRLRLDYDSGKGVLGIEPLMTLYKGKQKESLGYHNYIAGVIDTNVPGGLGEGILSFRISEITKIDKRGKNWSFGLRDWGGYYMSVPKFIETENEGWVCKGFTIDGETLGDLKILDIETPKE